MGKVNFISTNFAKYSALALKDAETLYFIDDVKKIYKGSTDVTESLKVVSTFEDTPGADIVEGKLYMNATTFEVRIKNQMDWVILSPGYISDGTQFVEGNLGKLATIGAIKKYITDEIAAITGGTEFIKDVTWDSELGNLHLDKGEEQPTLVPLTGLAHSAVYDKTNLKLTIPVYGSEDLVIDIPKDNFVRSGRYEATYSLPDGSEGPAIVLVVEDGTTSGTMEVVIPAASLVDVYTGGTTNTATVSVSSGNVITANVVIDPVAGNAIVSSETGLRVDISGKVDKLAATAETHLLTGSATGGLHDSGMTLLSTGDMGSSSTNVPVASVIAAAITTAIQASQKSFEDALALITNATSTGRLDQLEVKVNELAESIIGQGEAAEVIVSTQSGIERSGKKIGASTLAATPTADTLATEAAVVDAISWKTLD